MTILKVAGFVYEPLLIESDQTFFVFFRVESTKQIFWTPQVESHPGNEPFEHQRSNQIELNPRIRDTNPHL